MKSLGAVSQDVQRPAGETATAALHVYARDGDARIRLVADGSPVLDAERLYDVCFVSSPQEASELAAICAGYLGAAKMPADPDGWHPFPASGVPNLLAVARNRLWSADHAAGDAVAPSKPCSRTKPRTATARVRRAPWPKDRNARAVALAHRGFSAKQIAADPVVASSPAAIHKRLQRLGVPLKDSPRGQIMFDLPLDATVVIDRVSASVGQSRDLFLRGYIIRATRDPARFGLVVVST